MSRGKFLSQFIPLKGVTGIYWFMFGNECRYVGKADCIYKRMKSHQQRFVGFSFFRWIPLNEYVDKMNYVNAKRLLSLMEARQIALLKPKENKKRPCPGNLYFDGLTEELLEANAVYAKLMGFAEHRFNLEVAL